MKIAINLGTGFKAIEAEPVTVLGLDLAIHKTPGKSGWSITYPRSGCALASKQPSREMAKAEVVARLQSYGFDRAVSILDKQPAAPPVDTLPDYVTPVKVKTAPVDVAKIVDLVGRMVGGLSDAEKQAVSSALNSRTGRLLAKAPSAFGSEAEQLASAAWNGLQPNGYKLKTFSIFTFRGEALALFDKLSKVRWPDAFDKDKSALVAAGVW